MVSFTDGWCYVIQRARTLANKVLWWKYRDKMRNCIWNLKSIFKRMKEQCLTSKIVDRMWGQWRQNTNQKEQMLPRRHSTLTRGVQIPWFSLTTVPLKKIVTCMYWHLLIVPLSWILWQILISHCKFIMPKALKWGILHICTLFIYKDIPTNKYKLLSF